jgi:Zn-dependent protease
MGSLTHFIRQALIGLAIGSVALALLLLMAWQSFAVGLSDGTQAMLGVSAAGLTAWFATIVLHEVGHAVAGRMVGLTVRSVTLGPVRFEWQNGWLRLRPNARWFDPAYIVFHNMSGASRGRVAVMVAGGPGVNIVVGFVCLVWAAGINPGPPELPEAAQSRWRDIAVAWPGNPVTALLNIVGLSNLYFGGASLVPRRFAELRTDGAHLLDLASGR